MKDRNKLIIPLTIILLAGFSLVKSKIPSRNPVNASMKIESNILHNNYNQPFAKINNKYVFLRKTYSQNLKENSGKIKKDFINKYKEDLLLDGLSEEDIDRHIDFKIDDDIGDKLLEELEFELIIQDADNRNLFPYEEKDKLLEDEKLYSKFIDEYKKTIKKENQISDTDLHKFIEDNKSELVWHKRISKTYIGKNQALRGQSKTYLENSNNSLAYEGFNYTLPSKGYCENLDIDKINQSIIDMEAGQVSKPIPKDDLGIEYDIIYLYKKDHNPNEHMDGIRELMYKIQFQEHIRELFLSARIEILMDNINLNYPGSTVNPEDYNLGSNMNLEEKNKVLKPFFQDLVKSFPQLEIRDLKIIEDKTLLYIDRPIKKYANLNIDLKLTFKEDLDDDKKIEINESLNNRFFKEIKSLNLDKGFSFDEHVNEFNLNFYNKDGEKYDFVGFGYTPTNKLLKRPKPLHKHEDYVLKEVFNLVDSFSSQSVETSLDNFGPLGNKLIIKVYMGQEEWEDFNNQSLEFKEKLENVFKTNAKFKSYLKDLDIEEVDLELISNWHDRLCFTF